MQGSAWLRARSGLGGEGSGLDKERTGQESEPQRRDVDRPQQELTQTFDQS